MRIQRIFIYLGGGFILFRKFRTKRQIQEFKEHADPALLAEEIEALKRENAEAPDSGIRPQLPTEIGTGQFPDSRNNFIRGFFFGPLRTKASMAQEQQKGSMDIQFPND